MGQPARSAACAVGRKCSTRPRSTYLGTEYSGPADRRPKAGLLKKTKI
jgi:hypothetical protein